MGYNDRNSQGRQPNRNASRPPRQVTARPLPANYVDEAERVIRSLYDERNKISTNKIRNLLSLPCSPKEKTEDEPGVGDL